MTELSGLAFSLPSFVFSHFFSFSFLMLLLPGLLTASVASNWARRLSTSPASNTVGTIVQMSVTECFQDSVSINSSGRG